MHLKPDAGFNLLVTDFYVESLVAFSLLVLSVHTCLCLISDLRHSISLSHLFITVSCQQSVFDFPLCLLLYDLSGRPTWPSELAVLHGSLFKRSIVSYLWNRVSAVVSAVTPPPHIPIFIQHSSSFLSYSMEHVHFSGFLKKTSVAACSINISQSSSLLSVWVNVFLKHDCKHYLSPWPHLVFFLNHSGIVLLLLILWLRLLIVLQSTSFTHLSPQIYFSSVWHLQTTSKVSFYTGIYTMHLVEWLSLALALASVILFSLFRNMQLIFSRVKKWKFLIFFSKCSYKTIMSYMTHNI